MADAGKSYSNIVRVQHNLPGNSFIGALATDRRMDDGGSGSLASVDALVRFGKKYQIEAQFAGSHTIEPNNPELWTRVRLTVEFFLTDLWGTGALLGV